MFTLIDDGTLDTVVECGECGQEERFQSESLLPDEILPYTDDELTTRRIENALQQAQDYHECS